jgi:uncharacterized protein YaiE (UPF0345 family)
MFTVNEYFGGNVKSIAFQSIEGQSTAGVIAAGEYEFGTSTIEVMTVLAGTMQVLLPGEAQWREFRKFESFVVEKGLKFKVKVDCDTPYLCLYK